MKKPEFERYHQSDKIFVLFSVLNTLNYIFKVYKL
jgi:hypothetical protein